ncbi:MAG: TRAP transporter substrate-binding protein [Eubacterium sp.]|nr:TRAP transporter substrate-binding protein [Eubacterium sp.]
MKVRKIMVVLLSALMVFALAACSGGDKKEEAPASSASAASASTSEAAPAEEGATYQLHFSTCFAESHPWSRGIKLLADTLAERSGGRITAECHYSDSLAGGNTSTTIEMTGTGANTLEINSPTVHQTWNDKFAMFALPYLFADQEVGFEVLNNTEAGQEWKTWMQDQNMVGVGVTQNGYRHLTTIKKQVKTPADISGMKIRIPNTKTGNAIFDTLNASPQVISMADVYTGLQNGTVDGQENPTPVITSNKLYEVVDYVTVWKYLWDPAFVFVNADFYNSLSDADREMFDTAVQEMCDFITEEVNKAEAEDLALFEKEGCTVYTLTDEENAAFEEAMHPVYDQFRDSIGADYMDKVLATIAEVEKAQGKA